MFSFLIHLMPARLIAMINPCFLGFAIDAT